MNGVAFYGKMGAGKSTLANALKNYYINVRQDCYYYPKTYSFGAGVKKCAKDYFDTEKKDRDLLVGIGMKMREVNEKHLSLFSVIKDDPKKMEFTYWLPLPVSTEEFTVVMRLDSKTIYVDLKRTEKKSQPER